MSNYVLNNWWNFHKKLLRRFKNIDVFVLWSFLQHAVACTRALFADINDNSRNNTHQSYKHQDGVPNKDGSNVTSVCMCVWVRAAAWTLRVERRVHVDAVAGTAALEAVDAGDDASRGGVVRLWDQLQFVGHVAHRHGAALQPVCAANHLQPHTHTHTHTHARTHARTSVNQSRVSQSIMSEIADRRTRQRVQLRRSSSGSSAGTGDAATGKRTGWVGGGADWWVVHLLLWMH